MSKFITIEGFESLTAQEVFDISVNHVRKNGKPSTDATGMCAYAGIGCGAAPFLREEERENVDNGKYKVRGWGGFVVRTSCAISTQCSDLRVTVLP